VLSSGAVQLKLLNTAWLVADIIAIGANVITSISCGSVVQYTTQYVLDRPTALLQWISEYVMRVYTTADSAVSYFNHARIA